MDNVIICVGHMSNRVPVLEFDSVNNDGKHFVIPGYDCFVAYMFFFSYAAQIFVVWWLSLIWQYIIII